MSERGEAQAKEDTLANGAKPRLEERVRERGWRPTCEGCRIAAPRAEAARRRAIAHRADTLPLHIPGVRRRRA